MIGLQLGSCIAFNIVIGDLGPSILSRILNIENSKHLRQAVMVAMVLLVAFPLSLRRSLNSLSGVSTMSLTFYAIFIFYVFLTALPSLWTGRWIKYTYIWRPEGFFQCLPIFALAFACQAQLFIIYDALPEPSLASMNGVIGNAINLCSLAYISVGFLGYVAFADTNIGGDILTSFAPGPISNVMKLGFLMSIALSFPLIIFPCRLSIYTLCCPQKPKSHDAIVEDTGIPKIPFNIITSIIMFGTLTIGILIPNVEFILALCGSTTGCLVSFIMPPVLFIKVMASSAENKNKARMILCLGLMIMLVSTYTTIANQNAHNHAIEQPLKPLENRDIVKLNEMPVVKEVKIAHPIPDMDHRENPPSQVKSANIESVHKEPINPAAPKQDIPGVMNVANVPPINPVDKQSDQQAVVQPAQQPAQQPDKQPDQLPHKPADVPKVPPANIDGAVKQIELKMESDVKKLTADTVLKNNAIKDSQMPDQIPGIRFKDTRVNKAVNSLGNLVNNDANPSQNGGNNQVGVGENPQIGPVNPAFEQIKPPLVKQPVQIKSDIKVKGLFNPMNVQTNQPKQIINPGTPINQPVSQPVNPLPHVNTVAPIDGIQPIVPAKNHNAQGINTQVKSPQNNNAIVKNNNLPVQNANQNVNLLDQKVKPLVQNINPPAQNVNQPPQNIKQPVQNINLPAQNNNPIQNINPPLQKADTLIQNARVPLENVHNPIQNTKNPLKNNRQSNSKGNVINESKNIPQNVVANIPANVPIEIVQRTDIKKPSDSIAKNVPDKGLK